MKRKVPRMTTDEEAEGFLEQDLSDLDFSQFTPVKFEFQAKAARLNMRLPVPLLDAVKATARRAASPTPGLSARCWSRRRRGSRTGLNISEAPSFDESGGFCRGGLNPLYTWI